MKKKLLVVVLCGTSLASCSKIQESMQALDCNRQAVERSTYVINENSEAIEEANIRIAENRRRLDAINQTLKKVEESSKE